MGKLFINSKNLLDPSQSEKWTIAIARALDPGLGFRSTSLGLSESTPLTLMMQDRFLGPLGIICAIKISAMAWRISSTRCHTILHINGVVRKKSNFPRYLPVGSTKGWWHYDPEYIIPPCRAALGGSLWAWGGCNIANAHRVMGVARNCPDISTLNA